MQDIRKSKDLSSLSEKKLLELIFSNQLCILRDIQYLKDTLNQIQHGKESNSLIVDHGEFVDDAIGKCTSTHKRINENLKERWDNLSEKEKKGKVYKTEDADKLGLH